MRTLDTLLVNLSMLLSIKYVFSIDCYVCTSLEKNNPDCEDYFRKDMKTSIFINRNCFFDYFRGQYCIKLKGIRPDGTSILVRQCGDDKDWGSHCGDILYDSGDGRGEEKVHGCLESCNHDGCNAAGHVQIHTLFLYSLCFISISLTALRCFC